MGPLTETVIESAEIVGGNRENQTIMSNTFVPPLDWPHYGIGFLPAVKRAFQKYATFSGRASRSEFWWWVLANAVIGTVLYLS